MPYDSGSPDLSENFVINGDCFISQQGADPAASFPCNATYRSTIDCWRTFGSTTGATAKITQSINQATSHPILGRRGASLLFTVINPDAAVAANDAVQLRYSIEGYNVARYFVDDVTAFNPFSVQFWMRSSLAGIYGFNVSNGGSGGGNNRVFVSELAIPQANTWFFYNVPVTSQGFQNGAVWNFTNNAGMDIAVTLMAGANRQTANFNVWQSLANAGAFSTANQVNFMGGLNTLQITDLQVNPTLLSRSFIRESFEITLQKAMRYWQQTFAYGTFPVAASGNAAGAIIYRAAAAGVSPSGLFYPYGIPMRSGPALTGYNIQAAGNTWRNLDAGANSGVPTTATGGERGMFINNPQVAGDAVGNSIGVHVTLDDRL